MYPTIPISATNSTQPKLDRASVAKTLGIVEKIPKSKYGVKLARQIHVALTAHERDKEARFHIVDYGNPV